MKQSGRRDPCIVAVCEESFELSNRIEAVSAVYGGIVAARHSFSI